MKYNPVTQTLYTDNNQLIKKMHCPYSYLSETMLDTNDFCTICENTIVDTDNMRDEFLFELLQTNPNTCLKIDFRQGNIRVDCNV